MYRLMTVRYYNRARAGYYPLFPTDVQYNHKRFCNNQTKLMQETRQTQNLSQHHISFFSFFFFATRHPHSQSREILSGLLDVILKV